MSRTESSDRDADTDAEMLTDDDDADVDVDGGTCSTRAFSTDARCRNDAVLGTGLCHEHGAIAAYRARRQS